MRIPILNKKKPVMYEMFGGWGDRIEWFDFPQRKVTGWKQRIPKVGDLVKCPMQSGNDGLFRFTKVEQMTDPTDMFFADTEPVGYLSDYKGSFTPEKDGEKRITFLQ